MNAIQTSGAGAAALLNDVRQLIEQARAHVASAANSAQTLLYWRVGERIGSQLFLRSAIAKRPEGVIARELRYLREGGQMTPDLVFRDPYMLDFLFYHRHLRRLLAVELKLEKFAPSHKGQMELYLRWLNQNDRAEGEASPNGLILCASADREQVELLDLDSANIRVAQLARERQARQTGDLTGSV